MKNVFVPILAMFMASAAALAAPQTFKAKIHGDMIDNAIDGRHSAKIEYDISHLKAPVFLASIQVSGKVLKGELCPSLTLRLDGEAVAASTMWNRPKDAGTFFVVTKYVQKALSEGKKSISFELTQDGEPGKQSPYKIAYANIYVVCDPSDSYSPGDCLNPIFDKGKMTWESVFPLMGEDGSPAKAKLFFKVSKILDAFTFDESGKVMRLEEGRDFKVEADTFEVLPGSRIKSIPYNMMYPKTKEEAEKIKPYFTFYEKPCFAFFREGNWFHQHHVYISYLHSDSFKNPANSDGPAYLKRTLSKLKNKEKLTITLYGDSISHGSNSSARGLVYPNMPSWGDLVSEKLREHYGNENITYLNRALGGSNSTWGATHAESLVIPDNADLVILAFGMNDRHTPDERAALLDEIIGKVRAKNPDTEFILVCSMYANPMWKIFSYHDEYRIRDLSRRGPGIAVADVRAVHKALMSKKRFIDMTGNNINHPNDFLIRVYAQTVLSELIPSR